MANKIEKHFELIGKIDDISIGNYFYFNLQTK